MLNATFEVAGQAARLLDQQAASGVVPQIHVTHPETVNSASGEIGEIKCCTALFS